MPGILAFMGSPRAGGNTDILLDAFLEGARAERAEIQRVPLYRKRIGPCIECGGCDETGECVLEDDLTPLYPALGETDWVVVASPIFFYNITSRTQALVERSQALWVRRYVLKRPVSGGKGLFLSLGATKGRLLFDGPLRVMRYFFDALGRSFEGALLYRGVEKKGAIREHPTALLEARELGRRVGGGEGLEDFEPLVRI